jgi:hypothetical protein
MSKIDTAMATFPGFPGYLGDAPTNAAEYNALFETTWVNKPTWLEVEVEVANIDKQECKAKASALLYETDWTTIPDVADPANSPYLTNQAEFIAWRSQIRALAVNPVVDPVFPPKPTDIWG